MNEGKTQRILHARPASQDCQLQAVNTVLAVMRNGMDDSIDSEINAATMIIFRQILT
ncbi:hypothetical protein Poly41_48390 [Novipirellula artificiosorum]|uniref:Uncharacterized protein n=1 Tax=Novipirellula artificiosorum TaxID=2528016 RepID=A0A5C6DAB7_9BACT|nr:hypothetical protein Poly41_48390 [Novipirellula artificiosorum]